MVDDNWPDLESVREGAGLHLHWQGRRSYRSRVPAPRVLEANEELSFQADKASNLVIEGDNLQAMVSLRSQYAESFDVVYIDPPYNRGGNAFATAMRAITTRTPTEVTLFMSRTRTVGAIQNG